jgi:hypothetical protein
LRAHWSGNLSLALAFWVNLVVIRTALLLLTPLTHPPILEASDAAAVACIAFIAITHGGIFAWQLVGVVRACDRYQKAEGTALPVYGVFFGIAIALLFTLSGAFTATQSTFVAQKPTSLGLEAARERATRYAFRMSNDGAILYLDGSFERGITEALSKTLMESGSVRQIVLTSAGGNLYEGRGIGKVIAAHSLDTHVTRTCLSACTRAFIAGRTRTVAPEARLGFHGYRLDTSHHLPFADISAEQDRDRAFFRTRGVDESFLARMFSTVQPGIWIPPTDALLKSGVAHEVVLVQ